MTSRSSALWAALMLSTALVACGGGGGNAGTPSLGPGSGVTTPGGGNTAASTLALSLSSTTVTAGAPATVTAALRTAAGAPIPGQVVAFSTVGGRGQFSPDSALTDANGVATVTLSPAASASAGADTLRATSTVNGTAVEQSTGFQLTATNVTIQSFTSDATTLSPLGQTTLTVQLANAVVGTPVTVTLSSGCVSSGKSSLTPASATTTTGVATFTYRDVSGCGQTAAQDTVQARVAGAAATQSLQLNVTAATAASISFVSATPSTIFLRGAGFGEESTLIFQVKDNGGNPVAGKQVTLALVTEVTGGLTMDNGTASVVKTSDANGNVPVRINSGTVPTPVRVRASLVEAGLTISTVSSNLSIAVGLPSQLNFSLSQTTHNIEGLDRDGTVNAYNIIASDRLGNPVPDGTSINFITEGGSIAATAVTARTAAGLARASAQFLSASPRPADGRVTVVAYALGEESFLDQNGNNTYDLGEPFQDLGDVFLDRYFNNTHNPVTDQFIPLSLAGNAICAAPGNALLALDGSMPSVPGTCTGNWGRAFVRKAVQTVFSTSAARPVWGSSLPAGSAVRNTDVCPSPISRIVPIGLGAYTANETPVTATFYRVGSAEIYSLGGSGVLSFILADANAVALNPMAAGTTVTASGTDGLVVAVVGGSPVPSSLDPTGVAVSYKFDTATSGTITLTVTSPSGLSTTIAQFVASGALPGTHISCN